MLEDIQQQRRRAAIKKDIAHPATASHSPITSTTADDLVDIPQSTAPGPLTSEEEEDRQMVRAQEEVKSTVADTPAVEEDYDEWE